MTLFLIIAAAMVLAALAVVLPPLLGRGRGSAETRQELNVAIFRERITELDQDLAEGAIDEAHYQEARAELERDLLEDTATAEGATQGSGAGRWFAVAVAVALPLIAGSAYWMLGAHQLIGTTPVRAAAGSGGGMPSVEEMVARLAQRMEQTPDDAAGWVMLGRSYLAMDRYEDAVKAYEKAYALEGDQPQLLADYAEALSMAAGASMAGRPLEMIKTALTLDPNNTKALWLTGIAAFQAGEYATAIGVWRKLVALLPPDSDNVRMVNDAITRAQGELAPSAEVPAASAAATPAAPATAPAAAGGEARIVVQVALADALRAQAQAGDTVFIFARASQGPPMPLAAVRLQVKDLPATVTLDDSKAMMAANRLSLHQQVTVGARISKTGNAIAQAGDLQGSIANVPVRGGDTLKLVIDQQVQ